MALMVYRVRNINGVWTAAPKPHRATGSLIYSHALSDLCDRYISPLNHSKQEECLLQIRWYLKGDTSTLL